MSRGGKKRKSAIKAKEMVIAVNSPNFALSWKSDKVSTKNPAIKTTDVIHRAVPT